ncbi:uncharacterized protein LOC124311089 [Daphnia pulicaria]|uniref:uncharacterized protein LOC124311089 n=1 Tax=Daphnia pulicaria TaxID=35523 RepID=UPI001EEBD0EA|nr:uncharacterized protein LOC124311089 [Daphnia pulicaria]XP_046631339.1 uncharacterized protein LOC124311089 [Daphnia pulicaria]XP_046631340.1 uncharacterized protein LOC124311089 [Daphnia pulicaria]
MALPSVVPEDNQQPFLELQWKLNNVPMEAVVLSNFVQIRGHKSIRLGIQNLADQQRCTINLFAHRIRETGIELKSAVCRIDGFEWIEMTQHGCQSTVLFTAIHTKNLISDSPTTLIIFRVLVNPSVSNYRFILRDSTLKNHLWSAATKDGGNTDMDFRVQNSIFPAHKSLITARNAVLAAELQRAGDFTAIESYTTRRTRINITDLNPETFQALLKYMYTGEFEFPLMNVEDFWRGVATYELTTLTSLSELSFQESLKPTDLIELLGSLEMTWREKPLPVRSPDSAGDATISNTGFVVRITGSLSNDSDWNLKFQNETTFGWRHSTGPATNENDQTSNIHIYFFSSLNCNSDLFVYDVILRNQNNAITMIEPHKQDEDCTVQIFYANLTNVTHANASDESIYFDVFIRSSVEAVAVELVDIQHSEDLWKAAQKADGTDVEFRVGDEIFSAHRWLVASRSSSFAALFSDLLLKEAADCDVSFSPEKETDNMTSTRTTITIESMEPAVFRELLKYMYTGTMDVAASKLLLIAAEKYQIVTLAKICRAAVGEIDYEKLSFKLLSY